MSQGFTKGVPVDTDPTLAAASNLLVPSQYAVVQYVAAQLASGAGGVASTRTISTTAPLTGGGDLSANRTLSIPAATGSTDGYLTSANWTTFNNKENALTFSAPLSRSVNTISLPAATSLVNGYLSSADWTTFNNKQNALTNPVTGTGTNNEIAFFNSTGSTIGSLSTATYPSLTELSYIKGATSAIQTQLTTNLAIARIQSTFSNRVSGRYYGQDTNAAAATNIALATGTTYYTPIKVSGASLSIDQLAFNVTTTGTATEFRMAIYRDSGTSMLPDTVWVQTVSTAFSGTGVKTASVSVTLSDSYNWFLAIQVNGSVTITNINVASAFTPWGTSAVSTVNATYLSSSQTYGSFVNNPSTSYVQGGPPRLMMRTL